ncbi:MAG: cation transporter [Candidatus Eremiobacteraeota bacterium]|nr:cation transporter [Candidatus Eremiobacteraeota bacterium]MBC5822970.1 cation transporter [Candidatus Eremiobacteraeota bacterium]
MRWALALTIGVALLELGGGLAAHSLALVTDAAHVGMDAVALGIAVAAAIQGSRPPTDRQSYGFARFEIIAALVNGMLLFGITAVIVVEAVRRFASPELPGGEIMFAVAAVGFAVNVGIGMMLLRSARKDMNVRAALFHVGSDAVGALSVAIGGIVLLVTRASWIDPALSLFVAAIILIGVVRIVGEAVGVLLESAPAHAAISVVRQRMAALPGVEAIHDLHVWTIGSGEHVLSAHVILSDARISEASAILQQIEQRVRSEFAIGHVTVQFECKTCAQDEAIVCTQRPDGGK